MQHTFRIGGLAAVTLLGAFHLLSTEASAAAASSANTCVSYATGYAAGYCTAMGHDTWSSVTYTCNPDGTASVTKVTCTDTAPEDNPPVNET